MVRRKSFVILAGAVASVLSVGSSARAIVVDGTLDATGYGTILATQTNTSNTGSGLPNDADGGRSPSQNQLSNAYGSIDSTAGTLNLFFGGSIDLNNQYLHVVIDANPNTGVANLAAGAHSGTNDVGNVNGNVGNGGNLSQVVFDNGFRPETMLTFQFDGGNIIYQDNLTNGTQIKVNNFRSNPYNGPTAIGPVAGDPAGSITGVIADDRTLSGTLETAATAATATTGYEMALSLADLGYVAGSGINVSAFITQGSGTSMTNQVLAANPGADNAVDPFSQYNFDFTAAQGAGGHNALGNQYFTVLPAAVPEPASLGLLLGGATVLVRRKRAV